MGSSKLIDDTGSLVGTFIFVLNSFSASLILYKVPSLSSYSYSS